MCRGKAGRVQGNLAGVMAVIKGTPTTYNKDFQVRDRVADGVLLEMDQQRSRGGEHNPRLLGNECCLRALVTALTLIQLQPLMSAFSN